MVGGGERKEEKGVLAGTHLDGLRVYNAKRLVFAVHVTLEGIRHQHIVGKCAMQIPFSF